MSGGPLFEWFSLSLEKWVLTLEELEFKMNRDTRLLREEKREQSQRLGKRGWVNNAKQKQKQEKSGAGGEGEGYSEPQTETAGTSRRQE